MHGTFLLNKRSPSSRIYFLLACLLLLILALSFGRPQSVSASADPRSDISTVHREDDPETIALKAWVLSAPEDPQGYGEWQVRTAQGKTWRVVVNSSTQIRPPLPQVGQWVEINGVANSDDTLTATTLRSDEFRANQVIVRLDGTLPIDELADNYDLDVQARVLESANIFLLSGGDNNRSEQAIINQLKRDQHVVWAELNYVGSVPVADPYQIWKWGGYESGGYTNQEAFAQIELPAVQPYFRGDGVTVAILDTGVSVDHPYLKDHLQPGRDFVDDDNDPNEVSNGAAWGHGTHVAGVIAHIAPGSRILPVRVLDADGRGEIFVLAYAIEWAVDQGADVINLSLGTSYDSEILRAVVDDAVAEGVVVVAAAGNENGGVMQYPAAYANVLAVTALGADNRKATFANYSDWVDLAAPGVGITSTIVGPEGDGFASWSGTSMSTSFVSGVAALSKAIYPQDGATDTYQRLIDHAADLDSFNPDYIGQLGGLVSAKASLGEPKVIFVPRLVR